MAKHRDLKCWTKYFDCVWDGTKTFEFRVNDRAYQVGDMVTLRDYDKNTSTFKTRRCRARIGYILPLEMLSDWVVFSLLDLTRFPDGPDFVPQEGVHSGCHCPDCSEKWRPRRKCECCESTRLADRCGCQ